MKLTTLLLFLTLSIPVCAQFHNVKGVRIVERTAAGDSTTISGVGQIQYDADDDKLRFNDGTGWFSYLKDGATLPYWPLSGSGSIALPLTMTTTDEFKLEAEADFFSTFGKISIGNGSGGTLTTYLHFDGSNGMEFRGGPVTYDSEYVIAGNTTIPHIGFVNGHLAGADIPAASTATTGQMIVKVAGDWAYQDQVVTGAGNGISIDANGDINLGSGDETAIVTDDIVLRFGSSVDPALVVGDIANRFDSVSFHIKEKGLQIFSTNQTSRRADVIISADSGLVFSLGGLTELSEQPLIRWADDYTAYAGFTDLAMAPKKYVDTKMPLTGTADLTGNVVIDGNNHDLTFGSTNALDDFIVDADNSVVLDVDAGSSEATMTLNSGLYRVSMSDDGGSTADVQILVQSGAADILRIIKDESLVVIEIEADGDILMPNLPTDCTGRDTGTLWNDSNAVKLCP